MKVRFVLCWIAALLAGGFLLEVVLGDSPLHREIERQRVSAAEMGEGRLPEMLTQLGVLEPSAEGATRSTEKDNVRPAWRTMGSAAPSASPAVAGTGALHGAEDLRQAVPFYFRSRKMRVVSIRTAPGALDWIREDPMAQRDVPVEFALLDGQKVVHHTFAVLRIHGGSSRTYGPTRSWRLFFPEERELDPRWLGWEAGPALESVIVRGDLRFDFADRPWRYTNAMAFDVARRMGAVVPRTAPTFLFINGENNGFFFLTERIDGDFLRRRFGHEDFAFVWTKDVAHQLIVRQGNPLHYELLADRIPVRPRIGLEQAARWVDLESLDRWFLSILFCATTDALQGALLLDERDPASRWFWTHWDMDQSFMAAFADRPDPWNGDIWATIIDGSQHDIRSRLLRSLTRRSEEYRRRLAERAGVMLDQELTPEFLAELMVKYREIARHYELNDTDSLDRIEEFFEERPKVLRQRLSERLGPLPTASTTLNRNEPQGDSAVSGSR